MWCVQKMEATSANVIIGVLMQLNRHLILQLLIDNIDEALRYTITAENQVSLDTILDYEQRKQEVCNLS